MFRTFTHAAAAFTFTCLCLTGVALADDDVNFTMPDEMNTPSWLSPDDVLTIAHERVGDETTTTYLLADGRLLVADVTETRPFADDLSVDDIANLLP